MGLNKDCSQIGCKMMRHRKAKTTTTNHTIVETTIPRKRKRRRRLGLVLALIVAVVVCLYSYTARTTTTTIYTNTIARDRYICQHRLRHELQLPDTACNEPPRVIWDTPALRNAHNMPPITLRFDGSQAAATKKDCRVPCQYIGAPESVSIVAIDDTDWRFVFSMEGAAYYPELTIKDTAYRQDHYYATTSFQSEVPLPYFSWQEYDIHSVPAASNKKKAATFLANNCDSLSARESVVQQMMDTVGGIPILSFASCLHNADMPSLHNKTAILEQYMFHLSFENQRTPDYVTEKLWGALAAGTVPVYLGAPIADLPPHSVIFVDDFETPQALALYLRRVADDPVLYAQYQAWRNEPLPESFVQRYDFTHTHSYCRMCQWSYAKMYGLVWNAQAQRVEDFAYHKTCHEGWIVRPFVERWLNVSAPSSSSSSSCRWTDANRRMTSTQGEWIRDVHHNRDGVTDFTMNTKHRLELQFDPKQSYTFRAIGDTKSILQTDDVRFTFVYFAGTAVLRWTPESVVRFDKTPDKLRIIVEPLDSFHEEGAKQRVNYFGRIMTQDFLFPAKTVVVSK